MILWIAAASCLLAVVPTILFLRNLSLYSTLPCKAGCPPPCSVLIPARNEEFHIGDCVRSILKSREVDLELIVLDDSSTDRTAEIVESIAAEDPRVRLETGRRLPAGWCGKPFACHQLAGLSKNPILIFLDADVHVSRPDSIARLARFLEDRGVSLVSGVPREETGSFAERLIVPLIHFVLLGFLPIHRMRTSTEPRYAAACGQIIAARKDDYERIGGHATIPGRLHDGVALAHSFRKQGFATDLFDATDTFHCRMYGNAREVWNGFLKNAHEALGSPKLIGPATIVLFGGQLLPFLLLTAGPSLPVAIFSAIGILATFLPRLIGIARFRQSGLGALLHPLGIAVLLTIQWTSLLRSLCHRPATWRGRAYTQHDSTV